MLNGVVLGVEFLHEGIEMGLALGKLEDKRSKSRLHHLLVSTHQLLAMEKIGEIS